MAERQVKVVITGSSAGAVKAFTETALASDAAGEAVAKSSGKLSKAVESGTSTSGFSLGNFGKSLFNMVPIWGKVGIAAGIVVAGVVTGAIYMAAKYQEATNKLAASAGISTAAAALIGKAFLTTGGQTTFSAQQMVQAFTPVAGQLGLLNGKALTATQSLAFMRSAMALSEATGQSLTDSTAALAQVMQAYGIPLKGAATATDDLFNTSRLLNVPVSTLSSTLDNLHTKLGPLAPSLGDVSSLLVDLATHGVVGSRGLMAVNTGMSTLIGGSKASKAEIADLGLKVFDSAGKFVGMSSIIGQLAPKLGAMTQAQQTVAEKALFGATAGRELNATLLAGASAYNTAAAAATKHGTATAAADKASSGLSGSMDKVKASISNAMVIIGQQFQPILAKLLGAVAVAAQWFAQILPGAITVTGKIFQVLGGIIGTTIGIIINVIGTVVGVIRGIATVVSTVFGGVATAVKGAINGVIGIINFFIGLIDAIQVHIHVGPVGIDWNGLNLKKIPTLDTGGIVTKPTLALLAANSKPEAVIPIGSGQFQGAGAGGNGGPRIVNIYVTSNDGVAVVNALKKYEQTNGPIGITVRRAVTAGA